MSSAVPPPGPHANRDVSDPWSHRRALVALVPLAVLLLAVIVREPWYSNFDVDSMTHFEQLRSVADHGSAGFDNGPVDLHPELVTRWFVAAHGQAWGIMPAGMSYLLAPAMRLNGFAGAVRAIWLLLGLAATMVYACTFRLTGRPAVAVAAAYALVCGTSLPFWGSMVAPFVPAAAFGITAAYLVAQAFEARSPRREMALSLGGGFFASAALGCHLLCSFPWGFLGLLTFFGAGTIASRLRRSIAYSFGSTPILALMAWVNHQRFDSWNPVSYGPCDQHSCHAVNNTQTADAFLATLTPVLPYAFGVALVVWLVRRSPRAMGIVCAVAVCASVLPATLTRQSTEPLVITLYGYVIDLGSLDMGFPHAGDGPGVFHHGWCVLSLLQCTPLLVAGALVNVHRRVRTAGERAMLLSLASVVLGVLFGATLRAKTGGAYVWGFPFLNIRYVSPLLPAAMVLAAVALAELPWRRWHPAVMVAVAILGAHWIQGRVLGEYDVLRREVTHWLPLLLATATLAALAAWGVRSSGVGAHLAAVIASVTLGWGVAVTLGRDVECLRTYRALQDARTAELARCIPDHRFVLLGGYAMDEALALHDHRDIQIINVGMGARDGTGARRILEAHPADPRPVYVIEDEPGQPWSFHWDGYNVQPLAGCPRVQRIVRVTNPPVEPRP